MDDPATPFRCSAASWCRRSSDSGSIIHTPESSSYSSPCSVSTISGPREPAAASYSRPDWNNLSVLHRNTLPPRSSFFMYNNEEAARKQIESERRALCLSGKWRFHWSPSPLTGPTDFHATSYDEHAESQSGWSTVDVPGMWQLQGFGKGPQYTNFNYPWPVNPPEIPADQNECGRYITTFHVSSAQAKDSMVVLRFEGVDSAFSVWLNGVYIGYSQGARNPSEFNVSKAVSLTEANVLAVEVYQRCDGSYLEDQDQWWLSGIFRDVWLHFMPTDGIRDFYVRTLFDDDDFSTGNLEVTVSTNPDYFDQLSISLFDDCALPIVSLKPQVNARHVSHTLTVSNPRLWTAETPNLYTLVLSTPAAAVSVKVGFRQVAIHNGIFCINGQPVKLRGVNRHEHHPDFGRAVPYDFMRRDLTNIKSHHINAIRTSHYPNDPRMYDVADELGLYIMDEADLECHGFEAVSSTPEKFCSDNPVWRHAYIDRAEQLVMRDRNHACVVIWSLGNESFYGCNHAAMAAFIREMDPTRPIHYEPDKATESTDMLSHMYFHPDDLECAATEDGWTKPLVLCEFAHAMGCGPGALKEYIDLFYKYPRLMGGFVWEWANHGLRTTAKDGTKFIAYGGDFGDDPNDSNFVLDGLFTSTHDPSPGLEAYAAAIAPIQVVSLNNRVLTLANRYDFLNMDDIFYSISARNIKPDSDNTGTIRYDRFRWKGFKPHTQASFLLNYSGIYFPYSSRRICPYSYVHLNFTLPPELSYSSKASVRVSEQVLSSNLQSLSLSDTHQAPLITRLSPSALHIGTASDTNQWIIDLTTGAIASHQKNGNETLARPIKLGISRALTDNDRLSSFGRHWRDRRVHQAKHTATGFTWRTSDNKAIVEIQGRLAPPVLAWSIETTTVYTFYSKGVNVKVTGTPKGIHPPESIPRIGLDMALKRTNYCRWFGLGPGPTYRDMKQGSSVGIWKETVDKLFFSYDMPQENGNRTDVCWVQFGHTDPYHWPYTDAVHFEVHFGGHAGASFCARQISEEALDAATHAAEIENLRTEETYVRLDWKHNGLGTGSCGPATLPQYQLQLKKDETFEYELDIVV